MQNLFAAMILIEGRRRKNRYKTDDCLFEIYRSWNVYKEFYNDDWQRKKIQCLEKKREDESTWIFCQSNHSM